MIAGTVFNDVAGDGSLTGDPALSGATVTLYRDGGNGTLDRGLSGGDDVQSGTDVTDVQGRYEFEFLPAGRYFVEQTAVVGFQQRSGANVVTQDITAADAVGIPGVLIDDFSTTSQVTTATTTTRIRTSAMAAPEAIGGERDFYVELTSATGSVSLAANDVTPDVLEFTTSSVAAGRRMMIWDGVDGSGATLNATGLGAVDLTGGGTGRYLVFLTGSDHAGGLLDVRIYTDSGNWSSGSIAIPETGGAATAEIVLPFASFVAQAGTGANFANVGAISIEIAGGQAVDGQLEVLRNYAPLTLTANFANSVPMSLGNFVWNDTNNNGQFNAGEQPIGSVAVDLFEDTDGNGSFTPGTDTFVSSTSTNGSGLYQFNSLFPSSYVVRINPSNFALGAALYGFLSSTGNTTADPDDNVNNDDNGDPLSGQGVVSRAITLTATAEPDNDGDTDANTNLTVDFGFFPAADVGIDKADDVDPVVAGDSFTYTLTITNHGQAAATGVTVSDPLPAGVTFVSATTTQGSVSHSNGTVSGSLGAMAEGAVATIRVTVRVNAGTLGTLSNTATVTANEADINLSNNSDTEPTLVIARADLGIDKSDDVDPVIAGNLLTYTMVVTNHGPSNATGVTVSDPLPASVTFLSATTSAGSVAVTNGTLSANIGNLAVGATATITVQVRVKSNTTSAFSNTGTVTGNEPDTVPGNNSDTEPTSVITRADLGIDKRDDVDPVTAGNLLTYTMDVTNFGPSDATGVTVSDPLPAGVAFVSASATQGSVSVVNGVLTGTLGGLVNQAGATITVIVRVNSNRTTSLSNTATVTGNQTDSNPTNNQDTEPTAVITSADLEIIKTDDVDPVTAGNLLTYTLLVTNHGPSDATGVSVNDVLPAGLTFVSANTTTGSVSVTNGVISGSVGNLANGASATITVVTRVSPSQSSDLVNTATVSGREPDPKPPNNTSEQPTRVTKTIDLDIVKTDNVDPVTAGNLLIYTLLVTNRGPSDATEVTVTDPIPAGVTFVSATTTQGTTAVANGTLTANLGNLATTASATITVTVRVNSSTTTNLLNTATVTGREPDSDPQNNQDSEPTAVITRADLGIDKTDDVDPVIAGNLLTYTLLVTNHGPSDATGVTVSDPLPAGVTFVSASSSQGTVSVAGGSLNATLGNMLNQATATITLVVRVNSSTTTNLLNTATVTGRETDPNPSNNQDSEPTAVITRADLGIVKSDDVDPVTAGNLLTYTMVVTNHGPSNGTGVTVSDPLPAGVTFVSANSTQGSVSFANGVLTGSLGNLANQAAATITLIVTVNSSTTGTINNTASVAGNETDSNPANNQDTEPTQIVTLTDLAITKSVSASPINFGQAFSYSLLVVNSGPSDATGVTVLDTLPAGLTLDSSTTSTGTVVVSNGTITATIGSLARSATATVTLIVRASANTIGSITNTATVSGRETEITLLNNTSSATTFLEPQRAQISGFVYVDANNDGRFTAPEAAIAGVTVTLVGTDVFNNAVNLVQQTGTNGAYLFDNLRPGIYRIVESQPTTHRDGKDTASTVVASVATNDQFANINLAGGMNATAFNFGEQTQQLTKRSFLASSLRTTPTGGAATPAPQPVVAAAKKKKK